MCEPEGKDLLSAPPPAPLRPPPCSDWEVSLVEFRVSLLENSKWRGTLGPGG